MAHTPKKERVRLTHPDGGHRPMRRCALTRTIRPKDELLRLVLDPSGLVYIDLRARVPGRGIYIVPTASVVDAALTPKGLSRLFRGRARGLGPVGPPGAGFEEPAAEAHEDPRRDGPRPSEAIGQLLLERAIELVALARRAGQLEIGTDAVLDALRQSVPGATLILARDLGRSTDRRVREACEGGSAPPRIRVFGTKNRLGGVLGRAPTGVLLCSPGVLADRIAAEGRRVAEALGLPDVADGVFASDDGRIAGAPCEDGPPGATRRRRDDGAAAWPAGDDPSSRRDRVAAVGTDDAAEAAAKRAGGEATG